MEGFQVIDVAPFFETPLKGNVVDKPAGCRAGDSVARTHYFLRSFGVVHWTLSPDGILWFREYLAAHGEKARSQGRVPIFRPPVIASWKANSMAPEVYTNFPLWEEYALARRFSLDLDPQKGWGGSFPQRGEWPDLVRSCWAVVKNYLVHGEGAEMGRVYVFGGVQHEGADKPFSAHLIFADWCTLPTSNKLHAGVTDALAVFWGARGVDFDGSIYGSGLKYPYMDKDIRGRGYRGYTNKLTYTNLGSVPDYKTMYHDCDPLVLLGVDDAQPLDFIEEEVSVQQPARKQIRLGGPSPALSPLSPGDQQVAQAMIEYYQTMYDAGAAPQGGYPQKVGENIKINWRDSPAHECQHKGNNHKSVYFPSREAMLVTCMGNDTPLKTWVPLSDLIPPVEVEECSEEEEEVVHGFFDWLVHATLRLSKKLTPSVPIFRREFEASESVVVTPDWALGDHDEIMPRDLWKRIAASTLSNEQKNMLRAQLTNLKFCFVPKTSKYLYRVGPGIYDYTRPPEMKIALAPYKIPGAKKKPIAWANVWMCHFDRALVHDTTIQPAVSIDPFPPLADGRLVCWMIPRFVGQTSARYVDNEADPLMVTKVSNWWDLLMERMVARTDPAPSYPQGSAAFKAEAIHFLEQWVCSVLFSGRNTQVAVYICERFGGAGKTMMGEIMSLILGQMGSTPDTFKAFVNDKWKTNYVGKVLVVIDDSAHNPRDRDAASVWKSWITKAECEVEHKFGGKHKMPWYGNFLTLSNTAFAIPGITADERRVFALRADPFHLNDHFTQFEFNEFGQKGLKLNRDRSLEVLTGILYKRWERVMPSHADVRRLRSSIIADNQSVHEGVVLRWLIDRWTEQGTFVTPDAHDELVVPMTWGPDWTTPFPHQVYPIGALFAQFHMDTDSPLGYRMFGARFRQCYPDFMRHVDPSLDAALYCTDTRVRAKKYRKQVDGGWHLESTAMRPTALRLVLPRQGFPPEVGRHGQLVAACRDAGSLRSPEGNE